MAENGLSEYSSVEGFTEEGGKADGKVIHVEKMHNGLDGENIDEGEEQELCDPLVNGDTLAVVDQPVVLDQPVEIQEEEISADDDTAVTTKEKTASTKAMERALNIDRDGDKQWEKLGFEEVTPEIGGRAKWLERQHEREEKNKRLSKQKDGSYFSYMFLEKIFRESRKCKMCGARDSGKPLTDDESSLELYVSEKGVCGRQSIICSACGGISPVISCETMVEIPDKPEFRIDGSTVRYYCKKVMHFDILHDLMELLHIAALENDKTRKQRHLDIAEFMLHNARKVCKEWCRPENTELRNKRFLRLREETLLIRYKPIFMADHTEDYKEMYGMMAGSFRQHREKVKLLLELLKTTLFDNPTQSSFMLWVSIAMMHSENYQQFKNLYDPKTFMQVDSTEYQALKDRYLALNVALGIKKIPVVFVLFELPRFYHYIEFLKERLGKERPTTFLTEDDRRTLEKFDRQAHKYVMKRKVKSGKLVSAESHLDLLMQQEEMDREMMHRSTREKERAKKEDKRRQKKMKRADKGRLALEAPGKVSGELKEDESSVGIVKEISESLDDLERKRRAAEQFCPPYPRFRFQKLRERTSLDKDMVADMIVRPPYKSKIELLMEEDDRQWGMDGNWSRKDVLLTEEDMMFERKVTLRLNHPEKSVLGTIPICVKLRLNPDKIPTQGQILELIDELLSEEIDPVSFDGACNKVVLMRQRERERKKKSNDRDKGKGDLQEEGEGGEVEMVEAQDGPEHEEDKGDDEKKSPVVEGEVSESNTEEIVEEVEKEASAVVDIESRKEDIAEKEETVAAADAEGSVVTVKSTKEETGGEEENVAVMAGAEGSEVTVESRKEENLGEKEKDASVVGREGSEMMVKSREEEIVGEEEKGPSVVDKEGSEGTVESVKEELVREEEKDATEVGRDGSESIKEENLVGEEKEATDVVGGEVTTVESRNEEKMEGTVKSAVGGLIAVNSNELVKYVENHDEEEKDEGPELNVSISNSVCTEEKGRVLFEVCQRGYIQLSPEDAIMEEKMLLRRRLAEERGETTAGDGATATDKESPNVTEEKMAADECDLSSEESDSEDEDISETDKMLQQELKRVLGNVDWDQTPETKQAFEQLQKQKHFTTTTNAAPGQSAALLDVLKKTTTAMQVPIHQVNINPDAIASMVSERNLNPDEQNKLIDKLTGMCMDYIQNLPGITVGHTANTTGNSGSGEPQPMLSHVSDNVVVAIVTTNDAPSIDQATLNRALSSGQQSLPAPNLEHSARVIATSTLVQDVWDGSFSEKCVKDSTKELLQKPTESCVEDVVKELEEDSAEQTVKPSVEASTEEPEVETKTESVKEEHEDPKNTKKPLSKKRNKKIEKKAKQLVEQAQRRKAVEERYRQHRILRRTPSEEAFEKLMEKKDCTLDKLTPEEKRVLMDHVRKKQGGDRYDRDWERRMPPSAFKTQGPEGMRSRLRQKLYDRRMDYDYSPPSRSYSRRKETKVRPPSPDPPKSKRKTKRPPKAQVKSEKEESSVPEPIPREAESPETVSETSQSSTQPEVTDTNENGPTGPDSEKIAEVKEKLEKIGKDASMPKTEPMKSKVSDPARLEQTETPPSSDTPEAASSSADKDDSTNAPEPTPVTSTDNPKTESEPHGENEATPTQPPSNSALHHKSLEITKSAKVPAMTMPKQLGPHPPEQRVISAGHFRSLLVDHLKANEQAELGQGTDPEIPSAPKIRATVSENPPGKQPDPTISLPAVSSTAPSTVSPFKLSKKQRKESKKLLRKHQKQLLVAQVDTQLLRERGFKVKEDSTTMTVICNTDGGIEQVLDGVENPDQISEYLGGRYNIVSSGTGYVSVPGGEESDDSEVDAKPKSIDATKPKLDTAASSTWDVDSGSESGDGLSGFPLTSKWQKNKRDKFKKVLMKGLGKAIPIDEPLEQRKMSPPKDELLDFEVAEEEEERDLEKKEEAKKEGKRRRKNEKKKAEKLKRDEERDQEKREVEKTEHDGDVVQTEKKKAADKMILHTRQRPKDPPVNTKVLDSDSLDRIGGGEPLMLTNAPSYITLKDMEDVEANVDKEDSSTGSFVYKVSIANGGKDHPFKDIYRFARKRRYDLDVLVEVSEISCARNFEDVLMQAGKPGRISYNCKLHVTELHAPYGKWVDIVLWHIWNHIVQVMIIHVHVYVLY